MLPCDSFNCDFCRQQQRILHGSGVEINQYRCDDLNGHGHQREQLYSTHTCARRHKGGCISTFRDTRVRVANYIHLCVSAVSMTTILFSWSFNCFCVASDHLRMLEHKPCRCRLRATCLQAFQCQGRQPKPTTRLSLVSVQGHIDVCARGTWTKHR